MIEVQSLSKYYGNHVAVNSIDFVIERGEVVGLLGLNGAGKSTVLKIIGAFLVPSSGSATVAGCSIEDQPHKVRSAIGFLPDSPPLYKEMTVSSYLRFVLGLKKGRLSKQDIAQHLDEALARTNLSQQRDRLLGELSHGFAQRVGIAQAIIHKPPVLILDEPINGLDPVQIVEMRDLILSFRDQHTVILSSHILSEITRTCDRILIIDDGKLVAQGREDDLAQSLHNQKVSIVAEVEREASDLCQATNKLATVTKVNQQQTSHTTFQITVEATSDIRAEFAELAVPYRLLTLHKEEVGLESLFMKLIAGNEWLVFV